MSSPQLYGQVKSVIEFNGYILYGRDKFDKPLDQKYLLDIKKRGAVAVITDKNGVIKKAPLFRNKFEAQEYIFEAVPSKGIAR